MTTRDVDLAVAEALRGVARTASWMARRLGKYEGRMLAAAILHECADAIEIRGADRHDAAVRGRG